MDYVERMAGRSAFSLETLLKSSDLTPPVQRYLGRVYLTLAAALLTAAAGVAAGTFLRVPLLLGFLGTLGCTIALGLTQTSPKNANKRYLLLGGAALGQGFTLAPLCQAALEVAPSALLTAFLGTAVAFACFSAASALARRRSYLFLGAGLSSALSLLAVVRLASWAFGGGTAAYALELYGGLVVFAGYCIVDTQVIIEKAFAGDQDHIRAALGLFVDFVAIFVRVLVILLQNQQWREGEGRRQRKRQR